MLPYPETSFKNAPVQGRTMSSNAQAEVRSTELLSQHNNPADGNQNSPQTLFNSSLHTNNMEPSPPAATCQNLTVAQRQLQHQVLMDEISFGTKKRKSEHIQTSRNGDGSNAKRKRMAHSPPHNNNDKRVVKQPTQREKQRTKCQPEIDEARRGWSLASSNKKPFDYNGAFQELNSYRDNSSEIAETQTGPLHMTEMKGNNKDRVFEIAVNVHPNQKWYTKLRPLVNKAKGKPKICDGFLVLEKVPEFSPVYRHIQQNDIIMRLDDIVFVGMDGVKAVGSMKVMLKGASSGVSSTSTELGRKHLLRRTMTIRRPCDPRNGDLETTTQQTCNQRDERCTEEEELHKLTTLTMLKKLKDEFQKYTLTKEEIDKFFPSLSMVDNGVLPKDLSNIFGKTSVSCREEENGDHNKEKTDIKAIEPSRRTESQIPPTVRQDPNPVPEKKSQPLASTSHDGQNCALDTSAVHASVAKSKLNPLVEKKSPLPPGDSAASSASSVQSSCGTVNDPRTEKESQPPATISQDGQDRVIHSSAVHASATKREDLNPVVKKTSSPPHEGRSAAQSTSSVQSSRATMDVNSASVQKPVQNPAQEKKALPPAHSSKSVQRPAPHQAVVPDSRNSVSKPEQKLIPNDPVGKQSPLSSIARDGVSSASHASSVKNSPMSVKEAAPKNRSLPLPSVSQNSQSVASQTSTSRVSCPSVTETTSIEKAVPLAPPAEGLKSSTVHTSTLRDSPTAGTKPVQNPIPKGKSVSLESNLRDDSRSVSNTVVIQESRALSKPMSRNKVSPQLSASKDSHRQALHKSIVKDSSVVPKEKSLPSVLASHADQSSALHVSTVQNSCALKTKVVQNPAPAKTSTLPTPSLQGDQSSKVQGSVDVPKERSLPPTYASRDGQKSDLSPSGADRSHIPIPEASRLSEASPKPLASQAPDSSMPHAPTRKSLCATSQIKKPVTSPDSKLIPKTANSSSFVTATKNTLSPAAKNNFARISSSKLHETSKPLRIACSEQDYCQLPSSFHWMILSNSECFESLRATKDGKVHKLVGIRCSFCSPNPSPAEHPSGEGFEIPTKTSYFSICVSRIAAHMLSECKSMTEEWRRKLAEEQKEKGVKYDQRKGQMSLMQYYDIFCKKHCIVNGDDYVHYEKNANETDQSPQQGSHPVESAEALTHSTVSAPKKGPTAASLKRKDNDSMPGNSSGKRLRKDGQSKVVQEHKTNMAHNAPENTNAGSENTSIESSREMVGKVDTKTDSQTINDIAINDNSQSNVASRKTALCQNEAAKSACREHAGNFKPMISKHVSSAEPALENEGKSLSVSRKKVTEQGAQSETITMNTGHMPLMQTVVKSKIKEKEEGFKIDSSEDSERIGALSPEREMPSAVIDVGKNRISSNIEKDDEFETNIFIIGERIVNRSDMELVTEYTHLLMSQVRSCCADGGRVGLECVHCYNEQDAFRVFPTSVRRLSGFQRNLFEHLTTSCSRIPDGTLSQLLSLKINQTRDYARSRPYGQEEFIERIWVRLQALKKSSPKSASIRQHFPSTRKTNNSQSIILQEAEKNKRQKSFNLSKQSHLCKSLVTENDRELVTDYMFLLMEQIQICWSPLDTNEQAGFECIHCCQEKGAFRVFPSSSRRLHGTLKALHDHLMRGCNECPSHITNDLLEKKNLQTRQYTHLKPTAQAEFLDHIWERLIQAKKTPDSSSSQVAAAPQKDGDSIKRKVEKKPHSLALKSQKPSSLKKLSKKLNSSSSKIPGPTSGKKLSETVNKQTDQSDNLAKRNLVSDEDKELVTEYVFNLMSHLQFCHDLNDAKHVGFECIHCCHEGDSFRVFPTSVRRIGGFLNRIHSHLAKDCKAVPKDLLKMLLSLEKLHTSQYARKPPLGQGEFFERIWERLQSLKPS